MRAVVVAVALASSGLLVGCGDDGSDAVAEAALTDEDRAWCADHPEDHAAAARDLGIPFVGDYVRASTKAGGPDTPGLEPPILAVPASDDEPLTYRPQFENRDDSDRACRAALEES